jgi:hypothetical protein
VHWFKAWTLIAWRLAHQQVKMGFKGAGLVKTGLREGLGLWNERPLGLWYNNLCQKHLQPVWIRIFTWQWGGNMWAIVLYIRAIMKPIWWDFCKNFKNWRIKNPFMIHQPNIQVDKLQNSCSKKMLLRSIGRSASAS